MLTYYPTVSEMQSQTERMTGHDRCDVGSCGAQAYVRVEFKTGILLFCAHHYSKSNGLTLQQTSISIHDERAELGA